MDNDRQFRHHRQSVGATLPSDAYLPINRCNLPAAILGSRAYQYHPLPLELDGTRVLHADLFEHLRDIADPAARARRFMDYMTVRFRLAHLEDAGLPSTGRRRSRVNADYLRMVRGWFFDADGREGAVLKYWVERRFGLLARHHRGPLTAEGPARNAYLHCATAGIYATNAIEAQLDLLYTYCQYELARRRPEGARRTFHLTLYRGINRVDDLPTRGRIRGPLRLLLNNLNSFTRVRERADEFGDAILEARVPSPKVFFFSGLLPGMLVGEDEVVVIGGVYELQVHGL